MWYKNQGCLELLLSCYTFFTPLKSGLLWKQKSKTKFMLTLRDSTWQNFPSISLDISRLTFVPGQGQIDLSKLWMKLWVRNFALAFEGERTEGRGGGVEGHRNENMRRKNKAMLSSHSKQTLYMLLYMCCSVQYFTK